MLDVGGQLVHRRRRLVRLNRYPHLLHNRIDIVSVVAAMSSQDLKVQHCIWTPGVRLMAVSDPAIRHHLA
jgi:hypothetical protein